MQTGGSLTNTASNETCVRRLLRSLTGRSAEKAVHIWTGTCDANSTACDVWIVKRDDPTSDSLEKSRNTQRRKRTRIAVCEKRKICLYLVFLSSTEFPLSISGRWNIEEPESG